MNTCGLPDNTIIEEFQPLEKGTWGWKETKTFSFDIDDSSHYYNITCGIRLKGTYNYSNIWMIYELSESPVDSTASNNSVIIPLIKKQFQIELADQTGRWLGKGMSNLISFEKPLLLKTKLKKGHYTFKLSQNMREDLLSGVNDVGIKVEKAQPIL
jgi:gliding motility-associated lipoprotein GldH